jgi:effector-binding domain-containing protein
MLTMPKIVEIRPNRYAAVRLPVTIPFGEEMDPAFDELFDAFASAGVEPDGTEFVKFNLINMPSLEIDVGMTTDANIPLTGRMVSGVLPGGSFISMTYTGSYDGLYDATAMLIGWAKETGVEWDVEKTPDGDRFACRLEVHENNPSIEPDPLKLVTTILIKVA